MLLIISSVMSIGATLPGIRALQKTMSISVITSAIFSRSFCSHSSGSFSAYPPLPTASSSGIPNSICFAPRLPACSFPAGLMSIAYVIAPNLLAVANACSPATPAPITNTLAGLSIPTAVNICGMKMDSSSVAIIMPLYPAHVLIDVRASIF